MFSGVVGARAEATFPYVEADRSPTSIPTTSLARETRTYRKFREPHATPHRRTLLHEMSNAALLE
jgi:hypothetical protein